MKFYGKAQFEKRVLGIRDNLSHVVINCLIDGTKTEFVKKMQTEMADFVEKELKPCVRAAIFAQFDELLKEYQKEDVEQPDQLGGCENLLRSVRKRRSRKGKKHPRKA